MKTIWDKYHYDRQIIDAFLDAFEIKIKGYKEPINWKNILSKILVWDGFNMDLKYNYATLIENRKSSYLKSFAKWLLLKKEGNSPNKSHSNQLINCEYLFFLRNKGELEILIPILKKLKVITSLSIVYEFDDTEENYENWELLKFNQLGLPPTQISFSLKKLPSSQALFVFNAFLREKGKLAQYFSFFNILKETNNNLKKIIFVAGENKYVANFCHQIFKDSNVKLENLMNGAKYGWPNDADVDFDTWYVWSNKMKEALIKNANVNPQILKFIGHPLEDSIRIHKYSNNNLKLSNFNKRYRKVITLFTTSLQFANKLMVYKTVLNHIKKYPEIGLIVKAHPSDKEFNFFEAQNKNEQIFMIKGFNKTLLYDIIYSSNFSIGFGSTVSFESVWMGVPHISFEEFENSQLTIESDLFYHVNNLHSFKVLLEKNDNLSKKSTVSSNFDVTRKYVSSILNV